MAADITLLVSEFTQQIRQLLDRCRLRGIEMRPYMGLRDPFEQARLWRQSRSREEIQARIALLQAQGAGFLAHCLESVGPQHGRPVTNALPGLSWHQWGEAVDCFWLVGGKAEWSAGRLVSGANGYQVYAEEAEALGLTAGGRFTSLKDWPHVQMRADASPLSSLSMVEIDAAMAAMFGGD
jgi:hypothetical protein